MRLSVDWSYQYNLDGQLREQAENHGALALSETFLYDSLNRLETNIMFAGEAFQRQDTADYDNLGNLESRSGVGAYSYDTRGRLEQAGPAAFEFDERGNLERRTDGAEVTTLAYTAFDLPSSIRVEGGGEEAELEFEYTADGTRLIRRSVLEEKETFYASGLYEIEVRTGGR